MAALEATPKMIRAGTGRYRLTTSLMLMKNDLKKALMKPRSSSITGGISA
jgi:hypothetical protein